MNISLLLFIIGSIFIIIGYANQVSDKDELKTKYVNKEMYGGLDI